MRWKGASAKSRRRGPAASLEHLLGLGAEGDGLAEGDGVGECGSEPEPEPEPVAEGARWWRRHPRAAVLAGCAALVLFSLGVLSDLGARSELESANAAIASGSVSIHRQTTRLDAARAALASVTRQRDFEQAAVDMESAQVSEIGASLSAANRGAFYQGIDLGALNSCLIGVEMSLNQASVGDDQGALGSLNAVGTSCHTASG